MGTSPSRKSATRAKARSIAESYSGYRSEFDPDADDRRPRLLPKYGVLLSPYQPLGSHFDYGSTVVQWKPDVRGRATFKPSDHNRAVLLHTPATAGRYLSRLLVEGPESIMRLAFADATDFVYDPAQGLIRDQLTTERPEGRHYLEAQLHGDLGWSDIDRIVINYQTPPAREEDAQVPTFAEATAMRTRLVEFAHEHGYDYQVVVRDVNGHPLDGAGPKCGARARAQPAPSAPAPGRSAAEGHRRAATRARTRALLGAPAGRTVSRQPTVMSL